MRRTTNLISWSFFFFNTYQHHGPRFLILEVLHTLGWYATAFFVYLSPLIRAGVLGISAPAEIKCFLPSHPLQCVCVWDRNGKYNIAQRRHKGRDTCSDGKQAFPSLQRSRMEGTGWSRPVLATAGMWDKLAVLIMSKPSIFMQCLWKAVCAEAVRGCFSPSLFILQRGKRMSGILIHRRRKRDGLGRA